MSRGSPMTTTHELVDFDALSRWMDDRQVGQGSISDVFALQGGTQNVLLRFRRGDRTFVLRRPPSHPRMNGNETMRREAKILAALATTDVPHPKLIAACPSEDILGAAFYLMEAVDGFNANVALPSLHASDPAVRRRMGFALVEGIAALGRVDHVAVGLSGIGKPENFLWPAGQVVGDRSLRVIASSRDGPAEAISLVYAKPGNGSKNDAPAGSSRASFTETTIWPT